MSPAAPPSRLLALGNTAKLYCLEKIAAEIEAGGGSPFSLLDLGCGDASQHAPLLERFRHVRFVGVEPHPGAAEAARRRLEKLGVDHEVITGPAYEVDVGPVDVVTSFSVLEHVQRRDAYMRCVARHLVGGGRALMNYDAGHFRGSGPRRVRAREHLKTGLGRARALLRDDTWYQRFVPEVEARRLFEDAGMRVIDEKMFNSDLKTAFKAAPDDRRDELMRAWLDAELAFNAAGIRYTDALARTFRTRCFELRLV